MKRTILCIIGTIISVAISTKSLSANETDRLKAEVLDLRQKLTRLTNVNPSFSSRSWGNSIAIGIPLGIYNEDMIAGLDFTYSFTDYIKARIDAHFLADRYSHKKITRKGARSENRINPVLLPSLGIIGKTPMIFQARAYGGIFFGILYQTNNKYGPIFQLKALSGIEFFTSRHQAFFFETAGGGAVFTRKDMTYANGIIVTGGSRFYF